MGRPILLCHALLAGWACAQTEPIPVRPLALTWTAGYGDMEELAFSNDGRSLAVLTSLGFRILDAQDGRVLNSVTRFPVRVMSGLDTGICWSPDGKRIARAYEGVEIWDASGQQPERDFPASNDDGIFKRPTWSPAGDLVAVSANEGIVLLNLNSGGRSLIPGPADDDNNVLEVQQGFSWSPDGRMLAVYVFREDVIVSPVGALSRTTESERIDIWDVSRIALLRSIPLTGLQKFQHGFYQGIEEGLFTPDDAVVAWSPDGKVLAVDSGRTGLSLWSFRKGKLLCQLTSGIRLISWSRDSTTLHTRIDQEVRFINRNNGETVYSRKTEDKSLDSIVVSADGRHCAVIVGNSEIDLWRGRQQRPSVQIPWTGAVGLRGPPYWPYGVSPNGRQTVLVVGDAAEIRETESGRRVLGPFPVPDSISWSPNSEVIEMVRLLLGRLIRTADGQQISSFLIHRGTTAFSPNGDLIAVSGDNGVQLMRTSDGAIVETINPVYDEHLEWRRHYFYVTWSPSGRKLLLRDGTSGANALQPAVFSLDNKTMDLAPGGKGRLIWIGREELVRASIPEGGVQSPNGQIAAVADSGGSWRFWDLRTSRMVAGSKTFGPPYTRSAPVWSPDSSQVAFLTAPGALDVWDVVTGRLMERWSAQGSVGGQTLLVWADNLTLIEQIGGAVRVWRQP